MKTTTKNLKKAAVREKAKADGFYDGRFRARVETPKKHKKPKHSYVTYNDE